MQSKLTGMSCTEGLKTRSDSVGNEIHLEGGLFYEFHYWKIIEFQNEKEKGPPYQSGNSVVSLVYL